MAFRELMEGLKKTLPQGASDRYARLTALEKMLSGELYDHLVWSFDTEKAAGRDYVPLRERRPSVDFNLAHELTQDTLAELFGDEQFPIIQVNVGGEIDEDATEELAELIGPYAIDLPAVLSQAYEAGVVGATAVVLHRAETGEPFFEVLPAKWCEPVYRKNSRSLIALSVTYPIDAETAEEKFPGITDEYESAQTFWYRYVIGPVVTVDYRPLPDDLFARLGDRDSKNEPIVFVEHHREAHGFDGRVPAIYVKNPGGSQRDVDGPALWWPIRNLCVEADYTLSQAGRGLRYSADPMLFLKKSGLAGQFTDVAPGGYEESAMAQSAQVQKNDDGDSVRGVTQTIVGEDAKLLEISANGIREEREYVRDLREYALEVIGGSKARAEHLKGAPSGTSIDKSMKPLRRLVRRLRRPYGFGLFLGIIDLLLYGIRTNAIDISTFDVDVSKIPERARMTLEFPNDETLKGQELFYHVEAMQLAAGGSLQDPVQLLAPEVAGARMAADIGFHDAFPTIKGDLKTSTERTPPEPTKTNGDPVVPGLPKGS